MDGTPFGEISVIPQGKDPEVDEKELEEYEEEDESLGEYPKVSCSPCFTEVLNKYLRPSPPLTRGRKSTREGRDK
jgi:hypothetical protein